MSTGGASGSSTEVVPGFDIERRLGDRTWVAVQRDLGRRVVLRRLDPGTAFDPAAWPDRPGAVRLYAVVAGADGTYLALQHVPGARTLEEAGARRRHLDAAARVLQGAPHGRLTARDILVDGDGRVSLTGFGREPVTDDRAALAALVPTQRRASRTAVLGTAGALCVLAAIAVLGLGGEPAPAPRVYPTATPLGSALAAGDHVTVDCDGEPPGGQSVPCTIMQASLSGRALVAPFDGVVRRWAVRGASGRIRLVILARRDGGWYRYNASPYVHVGTSGAARAVPADRSVPEGAFFGLELAPGAGVGIRAGTPGARTARFFGLLRRQPEQPDTGAGESEELLLRVDVVRAL